MPQAYDAIKAEVEENGNVLTITMEKLRNAHGAGKLGVIVRDEISKTLAGMGLGHVPVELPGYQEKSVRLYKLGTSVAGVIQAALVPAQDNDEKLKSLAGETSSKHAEIIERIRELVAQ